MARVIVINVVANAPHALAHALLAVALQSIARIECNESLRVPLALYP